MGKKYVINEGTLTAIAEVIRSGKGTVDKIPMTEFGNEVTAYLNNLRGLVERSLTHLDVPDGTQKIGSSAFTVYGTIKSYTIPDSVVEIESAAFHWNTLLTSITFGKKLSAIGEQAFRGCDRSNLVLDFSRCESVPALANTNAFEYMSGTAKILVPDELFLIWRNATNWVTFQDRITTPDNGFVFKIEGQEYMANEGMTWADWVNSKYNTAKCYIKENQPYILGSSTPLGIYKGDYDYDHAYVGDKIIKGTNYQISY